MSAIKLKVCGMKHNTVEVAALRPDYLGFIFYKHSKRFFTDELPEIPSEIKKVGVFVNASIEEISEKITTYQLDVIQLHGNESSAFCEKLKNHHVTNSIKIWKVFGIKDTFNFNLLPPYEHVVDAFLFDTKGKEKGGNGYSFDWNVLKKYPSKKPFILSGGIGLQEVSSLKEILKTDLPIYTIDVNSKFEISPGLKNINDLKKMKDEL